MTENELRNYYVNTAITYLGATRGSAKHTEIVNLYNSIKPLPVGYALKTADDWCAAFVSAMAQKCKLTDIIFPECGCNRMITLYKNKGRWVENDAYVPKVGDIIFYDWDDSGYGDNTNSPDHVGIVAEVSSKSFKVIEGNRGNKVAYRDMSVNGKYIRGFGIPDYASRADKIEQASTAKTEVKPEAKATAKKSVDVIAKEVIEGKWGNSTERKTKLTAAGYDYNAVQAKVNELLKPDAKATAKKSVDTIAKEVIEGKWGNSTNRKTKLTAAGYDYNAVQAKVNELLKTETKVRVTASALNIRKGPSTNYSVIGVIRDKGVYTIVEEKNGWGRLKKGPIEGSSWISLAYTKKV